MKTHRKTKKHSKALHSIYSTPNVNNVIYGKLTGLIPLPDHKKYSIYTQNLSAGGSQFENSRNLKFIN